MSIQVNPTATVSNQQQELHIQKVQQEAVARARNNAQTAANASSTHNLFHANNLGQSLAAMAEKIMNQTRLKTRLDERLFREINQAFNTNATPLLAPHMLEDLQNKLLNLHSQGHLKSLMRSFYRRARRGQSTDQAAYGSPDIKEEDMDLSEKEKVKRKEGQTINQQALNDVIQDGLKDNNNPVQRFLLLSMSVNNPTGDTQFDNAVKHALEHLYQTHGMEIRAKINSLDEATMYANQPENVSQRKQKSTQFSDTYYQLVQCQTMTQIFAILSASTSLKEFINVTNLFHLASTKDAQGSKLPTSDPNTIHNLISFMHQRSSIVSMCAFVNRFKKLFTPTKGAKQSNRIMPNIHPKVIL